MDKLMNNVLLVVFVVLVLSLLTVVLLFAKENIKGHTRFLNVCGVVVFSCANLIVNVVFMTLYVEPILAPLKEQFQRSSEVEPEHRYAANPRGSTLDYGGSLDSIISERDALTEGMGLTGIGVSWHTDGGSTTCVGIYVHGGFLLGLFSLPIMLALLLWITKGPREAYWRRKDAREQA